MQIDVRVFKLVTGEEVIGRFVEEDEISITLERTMSMVIQTNARGEVGMVTTPFMLAVGNGPVWINRASIVGIALEIDGQLYDDYLQQTSPIALK